MIYADARFEGMPFTEPEVITLINGGHIAGHTDGEQLQVWDLKRASDYMLALAEPGEGIEASQRLSDDLHMFLSQSLNLRTTQFRGDQRLAYDGPKVRLGGGEEFASLDARLTKRLI